MISINYHHLYYFYVIAESRSLTLAAEKLFLNQSTLSIQLRQFERSLGKTLFERRRQRLILTPDGRRVLDFARQIFELGKQMEDALHGGKSAGRRVITAGILNGTPRSFGHALLRGLRRHDKDALIVLKEGNLESLLAELRDFRLDAILTDMSLRGPDRDDLDNHVLAEIPIVFVAAPHVARRFKRLPRDLNGAPFLLPSYPSLVYERILDLLSSWKAAPHIVAEVQDVELIRRMALAGEGIAPLNAYTVAKSLPHGGLVTLNSHRDWGLRESVHLITRRNKLIGALVDSVREEIAVSGRPFLSPS